jgi:hypothetical protein
MKAGIFLLSFLQVRFFFRIFAGEQLSKMKMMRKNDYVSPTLRVLHLGKWYQPLMAGSPARSRMMRGTLQSFDKAEQIEDKETETEWD